MKHRILTLIIAVATIITAGAQETASAQGKTISQDSINKVVKLANAGSAREQNIVGTWYYTGENLPKDYKRAATWWSKAAKQNYPMAIGNLGLCYQMGNGVTADSVTAVKLYQKSLREGNTALLVQQTKYAEGGNVFSAMFVASCYQNGIGVIRDPGKTARFLTIAAEKGSVQAQRDLGLLYLNGNKPAEAAPWFKAGAEKGDPTCTYYYGKLLVDGEGVTQDAAQGFNLLLKAAQEEFPMAQYAVGMCYMNGRGTTKNEDSAINWITQAARHGVAKAQWEVGELLITPGHVNYPEATVWFAKAVSKGYSRTFANRLKATEEGNWVKNPYIHYLLGLKALEGDDYDTAMAEFKAVEKAKIPVGKTMQALVLASKGYKKSNPKKAAKMLADGVKAGEPVAMYELGRLYEQGEGVDKDPNKGMELIAQSAEAGYAPAIIALADMYYEGRGVGQSYDTALSLLHKAQEMDMLTPDAAKRIAACYENGWGGVEPNKEAAQEVLRGDYKNPVPAMLGLIP